MGDRFPYNRNRWGDEEKNNSFVVNTFSGVDVVSGAVNNYSFQSLAQKHSYWIEKSIRYGNLNKTYVAVNPRAYNINNIRDIKKEPHEIFIKKLIGDFDINSTQVGYVHGKDDIGISSLYFTENFLDFLMTKQLTISRWNTPYHSLVRLLKKRDELGVYADIDWNKRLSLGYGQMIQKTKDIMGLDDYGRRRGMLPDHMEIFSNTPILFGEKIHDGFNEYKEEIGDVFDIEQTQSGIYTLRSKIGTDKPIEDLVHTFDKEGGGCLIGDIFRHDEVKETFMEIAKAENIEYSSWGQNAYDEKNVNILRDNGGNVRSISPSFIYKSLLSDTLGYCLIDFPSMINSVKYAKKSSKEMMEKKSTNFFYNNLRFQGLKVLSARDMITLEKEGILDKIVDKTKMDLSLPRAIRLTSIPSIAKELHRITPEKLHRLYTLEAQIFGKAKDGTISQHEYLIDILREENLDIDKLIILLEKLAEAIKKDGAIIGYIETNPVLFAKNGGVDGIIDGTLLDNFREIMKKDQQKDIIHPENQFLKKIDFSTDAFDVSMITNKKVLSNEGKVMRHCVGGYNNIIEMGRSVIYSFKPKKNNLKRFTVQLNVEFRENENREITPHYSVVQCRGHMNKDIPLTREIATIFHHMNERLDIFSTPKKIVDFFGSGIVVGKDQTAKIIDNILKEFREAYDKDGEENTYDHKSIMSKIMETIPSKENEEGLEYASLLSASNECDVINGIPEIEINEELIPF